MRLGLNGRQQLKSLQVLNLNRYAQKYITNGFRLTMWSCRSLSVNFRMSCAVRFVQFVGRPYTIKTYTQHRFLNCQFCLWRNKWPTGVVHVPRVFMCVYALFNQNAPKNLRSEFFFYNVINFQTILKRNWNNKLKNVVIIL